MKERTEQLIRIEINIKGWCTVDIYRKVKSNVSSEGPSFSQKNLKAELLEHVIGNMRQ